MKKYLPAAMAALVLTTTGAYAAEDVTSELYLPSELETLSTTSLSYQRTKIKHHGADEDLTLRENVLIGIGEETAVLADIGNRFNFRYLTNEDYNNDFNLDYELGVKKNLRSVDGLVMQLGASYYTYNPRSWFGRSGEAKERIREAYGNTRWYKELRGNVKIGYELENGLLPYASIDLAGNVDDSDRDLYYSAFAGVHKLENGFSFDAGMRYEFENSDNNDENWYMQGAADYFINDTMTLGAYADYRFAGSTSPKTDYGYTTELRFKVLF